MRSVCGPNGPRHRYTILALACVLYHQFPCYADAQERVTVPSRPTCPRCTIDIRPVLRIGSPSDDFSYLVQRVSIVRDSRGRFVLGPRDAVSTKEPAIDVYDATGRRLESMAPTGMGPGELSGIYLVKLWARADPDTLLVFTDHKNVLMLTNGRVVRELPRLSYPASNALVLGAGEMIVASPTIVGGTVISFQSIRLNREGASRTFGPGVDLQTPDVYSRAFRRIALGAQGLLWALGNFRYEIELWRQDGSLVRTLVRDAPWFGRPTVQSSPSTIRSIVMGMAETEGVLWTSTFVPKDPGRRNRDERITNALSNDMYDTVIEAIDVSTGDLLATRRISGAMRGFFENSLVVSSTEDDQGVPYLHIWNVALVRP